MIALIQRVSSAQVEIDNQVVANINTGLLAFIAVQDDDNQRRIERITHRIMNYRIFPDNAGKMNLSLMDVEGAVLFVPQFTLVADTSRGNRPSFGKNVSPEIGKQMFSQLLDFAKSQYKNVQNGEFGADMQVSLVNDGPVTFWLEA